MNSVRALLANLIDYAGLFPPAALDMKTAVQNYASYSAGEQSWVLGKFVVTVSRLQEYERTVSEIAPESSSPAWPVSVLGTADPEADACEIAKSSCAISSIEWKVDSEDAIRKAARVVPPDVDAYFELPPQSRYVLMPVVRGLGMRVKIRTGGLTPTEIPTADEVFEFILACARSKFAFKATAGLHHLLRAEHNLTYEANTPRATVHGFLNVFLAAAFLHAGAAQQDVRDLISEDDFSTFNFSADEIYWRSRVITTHQIQDAREHFAISFGSCSFEEPIADLKQKGLV